MEAAKPWYFSRTIWASVVVIAAALGGVFGIPVDDAETEALTEAVLEVVAVLAGIAAIVGRISARARLR